MAATNEVHTHLMGLLGSIYGAKAALLHGGEINLEILAAMQDDVNKAIKANSAGEKKGVSQNDFMLH